MLKLTAAERKERPIFRGALAYFPDALAYVGYVSKIGNDQHNPGEPMHWARGKSMDQGDALVRHQADAGTLDDDGVLHSGKVAWRALAQLQLELEARAHDHQPLEGPFGDLPKVNYAALEKAQALPGSVAQGEANATPGTISPDEAIDAVAYAPDAVEGPLILGGFVGPDAPEGQTKVTFELPNGRNISLIVPDGTTLDWEGYEIGSDYTTVDADAGGVREIEPHADEDHEPQQPWEGGPPVMVRKVSRDTPSWVPLGRYQGKVTS